MLKKIRNWWNAIQALRAINRAQAIQANNISWGFDIQAMIDTDGNNYYAVVTTKTNKLLFKNKSREECQGFIDGEIMAITAW